jgi:hypothetical protein
MGTSRTSPHLPNDGKYGPPSNQRGVKIIRLTGAVCCFSQDAAAWLPTGGMSKYRVCHQAVDGR